MSKKRSCQFVRGSVILFDYFLRKNKNNHPFQLIRSSSLDLRHSISIVFGTIIRTILFKCNLNEILQHRWLYIYSKSDILNVLLQSDCNWTKEIRRHKTTLYLWSNQFIGWSVLVYRLIWARTPKLYFKLNWSTLIGWTQKTS